MHLTYNDKSGDELVTVDLKNLEPNPFQVRDLTDKDPRVLEKVESIRIHSVIEPPILRRVNGRLQIAAGHIRIAACLILGILTLTCVVRGLTDEQMAVIVVEENVRHQTLNKIEQGRAYRNMKEQFHWTEEQIAVKFGTTRDIVAQRLRLLNFQPGLQQLIADERLTVSHGEAVNMAPIPKQMALAQRVMEKGLTVQQTTDEARQFVETDKANKLATENIAVNFSTINNRLNNLESRMASGETLLLWVDLDEKHVWKCKSCKHNVDDWCQRYNWDDQPTYYDQRLAGVANFKKGDDGKWHIQACPIVCSHCTVYEQRTAESTSTPKPA